MIARAKLEVILGVLGPRFAGSGISPADVPQDSPPLAATTSGGIAVISVVGTLVSRSGYLDAASGLLSYADVGDAIATAMEDPDRAARRTGDGRQPGFALHALVHGALDPA